MDDIGGMGGDVERNVIGENFNVSFGNEFFFFDYYF